MTETPDYRQLSLWWDQLGDVVARPPLPGETHADVAIVGAGYTGLWTAYYLAQADPRLRIVVLEAEVAGYGASGRNGGWCSALFPASLDRVARESSRTQALALQHAMHATVCEVARVVAAERIDADLHLGGTVTLARSREQLRRATAAIDHWQGWGFGPQDYRLLPAANARAMVGATDVLGATFTPHCARIQPAKLARGLAAAVERLGVTIHEQTRVTRIAPGNVETPHGRVRAPFVVRATEGYTSQLPGSRRRLLPLHSLMIATEPLPPEIWAQLGMSDRPTFTDGRHLIVYGQRTADDRLAFGGRGAPYHYGSRIAPGHERDARTHAALWQALVELFPAVAPFRITHRWGGALGVPRDWYATCGLDRATGIAWSAGYVGDGVGTSNLGGRTLADLILGRDTELTALPWVNRRQRQWEPEPARWLAINAGLAVMSSADTVEDRTGKPARRAALLGRLLGE